jgi:hypothetical protein
LLGAGEDQLTALTGGYHAAFVVGAVFALCAAVIGALMLRTASTEQTRMHTHDVPRPGKAAAAEAA